ncbi:hypothetical protein EHQ10_18650 [Leptospira bouyouniensis]|uniref:Uncharacterized protein n=1 Tax=Leptospira bouyouniensis TaxID=2484911 RepID=A0ABY2L2P2_9LEPT|nr:hypothetical protein EHQ10_18650 [Leptospira bouyouniensis]
MKNNFFLIITQFILIFPINIHTNDPYNSFQPDKGIHPFYFNETPGYNLNECKEKENCIKACPEKEYRPGLIYRITKEPSRIKCLELCDQMSCKLNEKL